MKRSGHRRPSRSSYTSTLVRFSRYLKLKSKAHKRRAAASSAEKMLRPSQNRKSGVDRAASSTVPTTTLRRSSRRRRVSLALGFDSDNSEEEDEIPLMSLRHSKAGKAEVSTSPDEHDSLTGSEKKCGDATIAPRREGLRPRQTLQSARQVSSQESEEEDEPNSSEGQEQEDRVRDEDEEDEEAEGGEEDEDEEAEEAEEQDGRRRYGLRNRTEVQRFSPRREERTSRLRSPQKTFRSGNGSKRGCEARRSTSRAYKRHRSTRADDSDDSLLVDEMDQGPGGPWAKCIRTGSHPWLGGLDAYNSTGWGLNSAGAVWGQKGDYCSHPPTNTGAQTAGPSSKGGADIQPVQVDDSVGFEQIGGLSQYIDSLKEMVFFPLLYPNFFTNYHITPPRGVLLCGPPGTGKTLVARALASAAGKAGQKVNFYMRKGADVLSKWVGEAERQLKLLFEEAQRCQPSIIFFDEIDGLAPVRSSKQEQIHNSIVSTLLALMDGLDSRGQVVVIGATNRVDAIDGALRRPGRFDREFVFPLPSSEARAEILDIHTKKWQKPPNDNLRKELAAACVGYCGADLKALCTEAAIRAFRKKYPQVYKSNEQFVIDVDSVEVKGEDFWDAMSAITPAAYRGAIVHGRPLSSVVSPCLHAHLDNILNNLSEVFSVMKKETNHSAEDDDESPEQLARLFGFRCGSRVSFVHRPRFLLWGLDGAGVDHLGPAVLHKLEKFPVHSIGLPSLISDSSAKTPEEALVHIFGEARRTTPSVLYLPQLKLWWDSAPDQLRTVLVMLLADLPSDLPVLLFGTSSVSLDDLDTDAIAVFGGQQYEVSVPTATEREMFFSHMIATVLSIPSAKLSCKQKQRDNIPELAKVPRVDKGPTDLQLQEKAAEEGHAIRRLRMCIRDICNRLLYEKRYSIFHYPVLEEDAPDYHTIVQNPMDVTTLLQRVDSGQYLTCDSFLKDVELIPSNAKAYNGDDYQGARIVSKACALRDAVHGMLSQMDPTLVSFCDAIAAQAGSTQVPQTGTMDPPSPVIVTPAFVTRSSARLRGFQPEMDVSKSCEVRRPRKSSEGLTNGDTLISSASPTDVTMEQPSKNFSHSGCGDPIQCTHGGPNNQSRDSTTFTNEKADKCSEAVEKGDSHKGMTAPKEFPEMSVDLENGACADEVDQDNLEQQVLYVKQKFVEGTAGFGVAHLEKIFANVCRELQTKKTLYNKSSCLSFLREYVEEL